MPTLAQLVTDEATATLGEGDAALHIDYRPRQAATPAMMRLLRDFTRLSERTTDSGGGMDAEIVDEQVELMDRLLRALCDLITGWDLLEDDGTTPVPLTPARLERIDVPTLATILTAVMGDAQASLGESNGMRSPRPTRATSGPAAASTSSRTTGASRKR